MVLMNSTILLIISKSLTHIDFTVPLASMVQISKQLSSIRKHNQMGINLLYMLISNGNQPRSYCSPPLRANVAAAGVNLESGWLASTTRNDIYTNLISDSPNQLDRDRNFFATHRQEAITQSR